MNFRNLSIVSFLLCLLTSSLVYSQYNTRVLLTDVQNESLKAKMEANASNLLTAVNTAFFKKINPDPGPGAMTRESMTTLLSIWEMSNFRCYETDIIERVIRRAQGGFEVRNIPVFMAEASEDEQYQEMVFIFTSNGTIDNIYISIESNRYNQLIHEGNDVTEFRRRQIILDFIENFRTAYNRKDITYLTNVFSEDALIITGRVVQVSPSQRDISSNYLSNEIIEYQRHTKAQYISRLRQVFANNNYINIKFDDLELKRHPRFPDIYGVNMMQAWNTTRYSDVGYLFLMIDFSDDDKPLIHVRTWQPDKIGGKSLSEEEKFKLEMFNPQK